jgi:hypothetical protein
MALPLATNSNRINTNDQLESTCNAFDRGFPFQEPSSIGKLLTDLGDFNINDENTPPENPRHILDDDSQKNESNNEVATLKAELDATRRKLAEYELRANSTSQGSSLLNPDIPSKAPFLANNSSLDFVSNEIIPWSDYDSSISEPPLQPHPEPHDFPASVTPLRLPSNPLHFQGTNPGASINPSLVLYELLLIPGNPFPVKTDRRSLSGPMLAPIGAPRLSAPIERSFSEDYKTRGKEPWKSEVDWSTPWPGIPTTTPIRQLTGTASLGVVYNDQQPWPDVHLDNIANVEFWGSSIKISHS